MSISHETGSPRPPVTTRRQGEFVELRSAELRKRLAPRLAAEGAAVLLTGDPGVGKKRLSQDIVAALAADLDGPIEVFCIRSQSDSFSAIAARIGVNVETVVHPPLNYFIDQAGELVGGTEAMGEQLFRAVEACISAEKRRIPVLLAQGIDQYSHALSLIVSGLINQFGVRVVATASRLNGGAARLMSYAGAEVVTVLPLTLEEAAEYLEGLLGVERVEGYSLRRWHRITEGNGLALMLLALALDREGRIGRSRGVAFETPGPELIPQEFMSFLADTCSEDELAALEIIALSAPLAEMSLLDDLKSEVLHALSVRRLIRIHSDRWGTARLVMSHRLLEAAVREGMPRERVQRVSGEIYDSLKQKYSPAELVRQRDLLLVITRLGLDAGREVPAEWLAEALKSHPSELTAVPRVRIGKALLTHPNASSIEAASALLQLASLGRTVGAAAMGSVSPQIEQSVQKLRQGMALTDPVRFALELEFVRFHAYVLGDIDHALEMLVSLEEQLAGDTGWALPSVYSEQAVLLAAQGRLHDAWHRLPDATDVGTMQMEWARGLARMLSSALLGQRGQFSAGLTVAERASTYALMGDKPRLELNRLLQFTIFINYWACGALESAARVNARMCVEQQEDPTFTGFAELCNTMLDLAAGKWRESVQQSELLVERLRAHDNHGLLGFALAALSLGLAGLGEAVQSREVIRQAEVSRLGASHTFAGYLRLFTIRARQWNGDGGVAALGYQLASWAREEELHTIEMLALHICAVEEQAAAGEYLARMRVLASHTEQPFSSAILAHFEELVAGNNGWESMAARTLVGYGFWMPLPQVDTLSAREREIALFASLGYSSRWIAEQLHLSVRTVDTHLRNVFTKLQIGSREELRQWFRREQQQG